MTTTDPVLSKLKAEVARLENAYNRTAAECSSAIAKLAEVQMECLRAKPREVAKNAAQALVHAERWLKDARAKVQAHRATH